MELLVKIKKFCILVEACPELVEGTRRTQQDHCADGFTSFNPSYSTSTSNLSDIFLKISRNEIRSSLSLKIFLRSFPRDKTCPRANGDVIVSPFKFYAPLSCHGRQGSKSAFYYQ